MRILIVVDNANSNGGGAEVAFELAKQFHVLGHDICLVSLAGSALSTRRKPRTAVARVEFLGARSLFAQVRALRGFLRGEARFDVQHGVGNSVSTALALANLARRRSARGVVIGSEHIWESPLFGDFQHPRGRALQMLTRFAYRELDGIICISEAIRQRALQVRGTKEERVFCLPNPVRSLEGSATCRKSAGAEEKVPLRIAAAGGLSARKDFATLLQAVKLVNERRPCRLRIAGEGGMRAHLEAEIAQLGLAHIASLVGYQADMGTFYAESDVFVLSSFREGFPLVLIEAMSMGVPLVATDCPSGPAEILEYGRLGRLVPIGDAECLAMAILETAESPINPEELKLAATKYDPRSVAKQYLVTFRSICGA